MKVSIVSLSLRAEHPGFPQLAIDQSECCAKGEGPRPLKAMSRGRVTGNEASLTGTTSQQEGNKLTVYLSLFSELAHPTLVTVQHGDGRAPVALPGDQPIT